MKYQIKEITEKFNLYVIMNYLQKNNHIKKKCIVKNVYYLIGKNQDIIN